MVSADSWRGAGPEESLPAALGRLCAEVGEAFPIWVEGLPLRSHRSAPGLPEGKGPLEPRDAAPLPYRRLGRGRRGVVRRRPAVWVSVFRTAEVAVEGEVVLRFSPESGWLLPVLGPLITSRFLPEGRLTARYTLRACCARP